MSIGVEVKKLRNTLGITQRELAEKLGVSIKTIANYESGGVIPANKKSLIEKMIAQSKAVNISGGTLVNGNGNNIASGDHSQITILENDIHAKETEIEHLKQIIEEKERLIQILMKNVK